MIRVRAIRATLTPLVLTVGACAAGATATPAPLSIEFGQSRYLTDSYLEITPGSRCGPPSFAPGGVEARAGLPDGSWFRVIAMNDEGAVPQTVILQRGVGGGPAQLTMRLDGREGIVRLEDAARPGGSDAFGAYHFWADWLRDLSRQAHDLDCVRAEQEQASRKP